MDNNKTYSAFLAKHYDSFYAKKHMHEQVAKDIASFIKSKKLPPSSVLDIGCGTGNHAYFIAQEGYSVTGIDISPDMIQEARKKIISTLDLEFKCLEVKNINALFSFGYAITNVINCLENVDTLHDFFKDIAHSLEPKGFFLFDCWNTQVIINSPPIFIQDTVHSNADTIERVVQPYFYPTENVVYLNYTYHYKKKFSVLHRIKLFTETEILISLKEAGFVIRESYSTILGKAPLTKESREVFYIVQKEK